MVLAIRLAMRSVFLVSVAEVGILDHHDRVFGFG